MVYHSNKQQRKEDRDEIRSFAYSVLFFLACLAIIALITGCSSLQENVTSCMSANRTTIYTLNGRAETFQCEAKR